MTRRFIARRLVGIAITLTAVATFTFLLTFVVPADPGRIIVGPRATEEQVAYARAELGVDDPVLVQYGRYLGNLATLDFGTSYIHQRPVIDVVKERLPWTILLAFAAVAIELAIGIPLGLALAARPNGLLDRVALGWAVLQISLPTFWVGLMLIYFFAFKTPVFPLGGAGFPMPLILPALSIGLVSGAFCSRIMREVALDALHSDYVQALRAKGAPPSTILFKHVLRASLSPMLTLLAMDFGLLMAGAVLVESVFGWPGLGSAAYDAMTSGDIPMLMACVFTFSFFVLVLNLLADLARKLVDPRVRLD